MQIVGFPMRRLRLLGTEYMTDRHCDMDKVENTVVDRHSGNGNGGRSNLGIEIQRSQHCKGGKDMAMIQDTDILFGSDSLSDKALHYGLFPDPTIVY